jgi:hypothetical protein
MKKILIVIALAVLSISAFSTFANVKIINETGSDIFLTQEASRGGNIYTLKNGQYGWFGVKNDKMHPDNNQEVPADGSVAWVSVDIKRSDNPLLVDHELDFHLQEHEQMNCDDTQSLAGKTVHIPQPSGSYLEVAQPIYFKYTGGCDWKRSSHSELYGYPLGELYGTIIIK